MALQQSWRNIAIRFLAAFILVFLTYNPSGLSYFHWLVGQGADWSALKIIAGLVLLAGWIAYVRLTFTTMRGRGLLFAAAFFACLMAVLLGRGWVAPGSAGAVATLILLVIAFVLGLGASWPHVRRRLRRGGEERRRPEEPG